MPRRVAIAVLLASLAPEAAHAVEFDRDVRPVLAARCYACHGPDGDARKAGLRLDSFEGATAMLKSGVRAIVPGKPDESLMVLALESPVFHEKAMPLVGPRPNVDEIALIRRWIAEGAEWPDGPVGRIKPLFLPKE